MKHQQLQKEIVNNKTVAVKSHSLKLLIETSNIFV